MPPNQAESSSGEATELMVEATLPARASNVRAAPRLVAGQDQVSTASRLGRAALIGKVPALVFFAIIVLCYAWDAPSIVFYGDIGLSNTSVTSGGDTARQVCFVLLFLVVAYAGVRARGFDFLLSVPKLFWPVLGWMWLSLIWAIDPSIAFRRLAFTTIIILSLSYTTDLLSYRQVVRVLLTALVTILMVDWLAVAAFPLAVHQAAELDTSLVGNWRGIHNHKNEAGAFCAMTLILIVYEARRVRSKVTGPALFILAAAFLCESRSKTSGGFVFVAMLIGMAAHVAYKNPGLRRVAAFSAVGFALVALAIIGNPLSPFARIFEDPAALTGRVQIWPVLMNYALDHPWLGAGYGSFWAIGDMSPIFSYASGWVTTVDHSHNGYIQIVIQTGFVGFAIMFATLMVQPFRQLFSHRLDKDTSRFLICSILAFGCLHDLLETSILDRATSTWVVMLTAYCLLAKGVARGSASRVTGDLAA